MRFRDFVALTGASLTPAQDVLYRVRFDGDEPGSLVGEDREIARKLFGDVDTFPVAARRVQVLAKGARIGGTRWDATYICLAALTTPLPPLGPGEKAFAVIVGPDIRLSRQALSFALGAMRSHPELRERVQAVMADSFEIVRDDGAVVIVTCFPATAGGSALRGRTIVVALMTETSFFRDSTSVVNDEELYRALIARIVPGGKLLLESTPWATAGLMWELYRDNFGHPETACVASAPTLLMRPDPDTAAFVANETRRKPEMAAHEFEVKFRTAGEMGAIEEEKARAAIVSLSKGTEQIARRFGIADKSSGKGDSDVMLICGVISSPSTESIYLEEDRHIFDAHGRPLTTRVPKYFPEGHPRYGAPIPNPLHTATPKIRICVFDTLAFEGRFSDDLSFDQVIARQAEFLRAHGAQMVIGDEHVGFPTESAFSRHGIKFESRTTTPKGLLAGLTMARSLLKEGRLCLVPNAEATKAVDELCALQVVITGGGQTTVRSRRTSKGHGDRASAILLLSRLIAEADPVIPGAPYLKASGMVGAFDPYTDNPAADEPQEIGSTGYR